MNVALEGIMCVEW